MWDYFKCIAVFLLSMNCYSQVKTPFEMDQELTQARKQFKILGYGQTSDSLNFEHNMYAYLSDTSSFSNPFDSLKNEISVVYSPDKKLKFYCWVSGYPDPYFYFFESLVQYKLPNGKVVLIRLGELDEEYNVRYIYGVHEVVIEGVTYYVTLGEGMHSESYATVRLLSLAGNKLVDCLSCFENNKPVSIMYNYFGKNCISNMVFDTVTKNIAVKIFDRDSPEPAETDKIIRFVNGKYVYKGNE